MTDDPANQNPPPPPDPLPAGPANTAAPAGPLTGEHLQALSLANQRGKKIRIAAGVARFNGVSMGVFSGLSLLVAMGMAAFGEFDWIAWVMGAGLGALAWNELRGRRLLLRLDPRGPVVLGWNQLALLGLVFAYAAWMLWSGLVAPSPYEEAMRTEPMLRQMLGDPDNLYRTLTLGIYGSLMVVTVIFQGFNSLYYFTRGRVVRGYLAQTPAWVVDVQRCQAPGQ